VSISSLLPRELTNAIFPFVWSRKAGWSISPLRRARVAALATWPEERPDVFQFNNPTIANVKAKTVRTIFLVFIAILISVQHSQQSAALSSLGRQTLGL
jgi:hypothetical protein